MAQITLNSSGVASSGSLLLQTNGTTTQATVDTSGNLGLGVTPSAWSGFTALQIQNGALFTDSTSFRSIMNGYYNGSNWIYSTTNAATRYEQVNGIHRWFNAASGTAGNSISFTQAMTLDASGNLGIGTTSPSTRLHVAGGAGTEVRVTSSASLADGTGSAIVRFGGSNSATSGYVGYGGTANDYYAWNALSGNMIFGTANLERARIDSSGNLLVGTTSRLFNDKFNVTTVNGTVAYSTFHNQNASAGNELSIVFARNSSTVGSITTSLTATGYNTSSDYRLKENIQPMTGALAKVAALKPVTYTWKADGSDGEGFIAHELAEVIPNAVTGEKDAVETYTDEEGNEQTRPKYQGIDTSFLVATLTAAIQEQQAIITQLQADVAALKG